MELDGTVLPTMKYRLEIIYPLAKGNENGTCLPQSQI